MNSNNFKCKTGSTTYMVFNQVLTLFLIMSVTSEERIVPNYKSFYNTNESLILLFLLYS